MIKLLLLFLFTSIGTISFAQSADTFSISGRAVSAYSSKPIGGGSVIIAKGIGTTCDTAGRFSILGLHQDKYKLSFRSLGYAGKDTVITIEGKSIRNLVVSMPVDCKYFNRQKAIKDIKNKKAILFVNGRESERDQKVNNLFQTKYSIQLRFNNFEVASEDCMGIYNQPVIEHLDKVYGKEWRNDLGVSVFGLR